MTLRASKVSEHSIWKKKDRHYFPEIFKVSADCRYGNCTHRHEPGCAVREAVEKHYISESR
ncbi:hypothetical protein [Bacteroides uniformis]|uniref:hypothetical protein n=1 Tax=Bacteroides uniformis TaxID=820 RepID=UPI003978C284